MQADAEMVVGITVRFFASLRELAGEGATRLTLPEGSRAGDVWEACVQRWPALATRRQSTVLAINQEFARPDTEVHDGDEVALLPPVSGGVYRSRGSWCGDTDV